MTQFADKVVQQCLSEFNRFNKGKGRETKDPYAGYVGEYWAVGVKKNNIDGRTTFQQDGVPFRPAWSSAFISFVMRKCGADETFLYHEAHIHYVVKAIRDAKGGHSSKFLGRDPASYVPKLGDIINGGRGKARTVTYSTVLTRYGRKAVGKGNFLPTHSDIVVEVDATKRELITIGGNVETDTVGKKIWKLKSDGTLAKGPPLICVIECLL